MLRVCLQIVVTLVMVAAAAVAVVAVAVAEGEAVVAAPAVVSVSVVAAEEQQTAVANAECAACDWSLVEEEEAWIQMVASYLTVVFVAAAEVGVEVAGED